MNELTITILIVLFLNKNKIVFNRVQNSTLSKELKKYFFLKRQNKILSFRNTVQYILYMLLVY